MILCTTEFASLKLGMTDTEFYEYLDRIFADNLDKKAKDKIYQFFSNGNRELRELIKFVNIEALMKSVSREKVDYKLNFSIQFSEDCADKIGKVLQTLLELLSVPSENKKEKDGGESNDKEASVKN